MPIMESLDLDSLHCHEKTHQLFCNHFFYSVKSFLKALLEFRKKKEDKIEGANEKKSHLKVFQIKSFNEFFLSEINLLPCLIVKLLEIQFTETSVKAFFKSYMLYA